MMDYLSRADDIISGMRLIVEGAIVLYEGDASPLCRLAQKEEKPEAQTAFSTIGKALYDLQQYVIELAASRREENKS